VCLLWSFSGQEYLLESGVVLGFVGEVVGLFEGFVFASLPRQGGSLKTCWQSILTI